MSDSVDDPAVDELNHPTDLSLAVADHLVQFVNGRLRAGATDWRREVERYLAYRPLWEVVILHNLSQHFEDIVSGLRRPTPDVSRLYMNWLHTDVSTRQAWMVHRLLGLAGVDRGQESEWIDTIDELAGQEIHYRQAVDDRPEGLSQPLETRIQVPAATAKTTPKSSRPPQRMRKRTNLRSLAKRLPEHFTADDAAEAFGTRGATTYNWLRRLRAAGLVDRNADGWIRIDKPA